MSKNLEPSSRLLFVSAQASAAEVKEKLDFLYGDKKETGESFVESVTTAITTYHKNTSEDEVFQEKIAAVESNKYAHAIITTHGAVRKRGKADDAEASLKENRVGETHYGLSLDILEQIKSLREKGIQDFHIVTCNGGALIHDIDRDSDQLKGTNITIYSSSKYGTTNAIMDFVGKTFHEILTDGSKNYDEISEIVVGNRLKFSAETIIFSSISQEGTFAAVKFRNPKEASQNLAKERDQLGAFDSPDSLIDYFSNSAFVPIYLNKINSDGDRVELASTALTRSLEKVTALKDLPPLEKEEFFKDQLKYSLSKAAANKKSRTVEKIIEVSSKMIGGEDVLNYQDEVGSSVLMWASISGNLEIVQNLLHSGKVDINQVNNAGGTALMLATLNGEADVVAKLLQSGASANEPVNIYGGSSLTYALMLDVGEGKSDDKKMIVKSILEKLAEERSKNSEFVIKGSGVGDDKTLSESLQNYIQNLLEKGDNSEELQSIINLSKKLNAESVSVTSDMNEAEEKESFVTRLNLQKSAQKESMKNSAAKNPLVILIGEAGHGDLSYGSLIQQIAERSGEVGLKFQIFSEFGTQSDKIAECQKRPEFGGGTIPFINEPSEQNRDQTTAFLDKNFTAIGIANRQQLIEERFKEFAEKGLSAREVVEQVSKENNGNLSMSPKMLAMLDPETMTLETLKSQWGSALYYPVIHQKMIEDIHQKRGEDVDVVIVVTGFGHSYGMDQKLKQEFAGSDRYAVTNFMKYSGPDDVELRQQIRADEERFAPVGNHGLIGFEVDGQNTALVPDIITRAITEKSKLKSPKLEQENKSASSTWVEKLGLEPSDVRRMGDNPTQGRS